MTEHRVVCAIVVAVAVLDPQIVRAQAASVAPPAAGEAAPSPARFSRWADLQSFNLGFRYRSVENSVGVRTSQHVQNRLVFKGRMKFDRPGHYALHAGVSSGPSSTISWNNTGVGSGDPERALHLRHLYVAAMPVSAFEIQYGSLYAVRGESTEITSYDNDVYLTGQRASVKRPVQLWFDEISVTRAYLGDVTTPDIWERYRRLGEANYHQILVGKKLGTRGGISADYTEIDDVPTWRGAFTLKAAEIAVLDAFRVEAYARAEGGPTPFGWALTLDKRVGRTSTSGGFASVDERYGGLNGDYYNRGNRWFGKATANLFPLVSVSGQFTHALDADYAIANKQRFDVVLTYDVLRTLSSRTRR
jgi:hypothetical protein